MLNITFQQIEIFLEVAKRLNITAVAEDMYVTQSAVSRSISRLESSLGLVLFERNRRGLKLTHDGKALYDKLQLHFPSICSTIAELQSKENAHTVLLRIGYPNTIDSNRDYDKLNSFISEYKRTHPEISFSEAVYGFEELKSKLRYDELDLVFLPNFTMYDQQELNTDSMIVCRFRINVALSKFNPAIKHDELDLNILRKQPLFTTGHAGYSETLSDFLREIEYDTTQSIIIPNHDTLLRSVKNSNWGFALIGNQRFIEGSGIKLFPTTKNDYTLSLHMAWRIDNENVELRRFIKSVAENQHNITNF